MSILSQIVVHAGNIAVAVPCGLSTTVSAFRSDLATELAFIGINIGEQVQVQGEQPYSSFSLLPPPSLRLRRSDAMSVEECAADFLLAQTSASTRNDNWAAFMSAGGILHSNDLRTLADIGFGSGTILRITMME